MPERSVKVSLVAQVSGYISGMQAAAAKTRELGSESEKLGQKRAAIEGLGKSLLAIGAVAAAGVGLAIAKYAEFDQAMSSVQAATHASAAEMGQLRDAAIEAGAKTVFTATEAANAIEELSKAGVSTADVLNGGLSGALDLASAGQLKVADAAQIAATAMTQFNLEGAQVPHVADLLAAGAGKAQGEVTDLAQALNQGGLVASQAGFKIEETTGVLSAFAAAGLLGSDAGTSLKTAIIQLQNPSKQAAGVMKQYGIDVYDSSGQMLSFGGIAAQLKDRLGGLSDEQRNAALATIFGNDAVRAANVLYANGAEGIADWTAKVDDNGYAAETARIKLDNLKGDVEQLGGAFDTALIQSGSAGNDSLRGIVQTATSALDVFNGLPQPLQSAALGLGAVVAGIALTGGAALVAVPKLAEFRAGLSTLGITADSTKAKLSSAGAFLRGPWGIAIAGAVAAATLFIGAQAQSASYTKQLRDSLDQTTGSMTKNTKELVANALAAKTSIFGVEVSGSSAYDKAKRLGVSLDTVTKAAQGNTAAYKELLAVQKDIRGSDDNDYITKKYGEGLSDASGDITELVQAVEKQRGAMSSAKEQQDQLSEAQKKGADSADGAGDAAASAAEQYNKEAARVSDLASELAQLVEQFDKVNGVNQDAISANAAYQEALAGLSAQVKEQRESTKGYTTTLDENTAIGAGNASMLSDLASKAQEAAQKQYSVDQSTMSAKDAADKYAGTLAAQRQKFIESATAAGFNAGEVKKLADRVFQLPSEKQIKLLAETSAAEGAIERVNGKLSLLYQNYNGKHINIIADVSGPAAAAVATGHVAYAEGGAVYGPGTSTSDSITARLSAGEHVLDARDVQLMGGQQGVYAFRAALERGLGRFAEGGAIQRTYVQAPPTVYAAAAGASGSAVPQTVSFAFQSSGNARRDLDDAMFHYKTKIRGGR